MLFSSSSSPLRSNCSIGGPVGHGFSQYGQTFMVSGKSICTVCMGVDGGLMISSSVFGRLTSHPTVGNTMLSSSLDCSDKACSAVNCPRVPSEFCHMCESSCAETHLHCSMSGALYTLLPWHITVQRFQGITPSVSLEDWVYVPLLSYEILPQSHKQSNLLARHDPWPHAI